MLAGSLSAYLLPSLAGAPSKTVREGFEPKAAALLSSMHRGLVGQQIEHGGGPVL